MNDEVNIERDYDDPCAMYKLLRTAYFRLLSGQMEASVSYLHNGVNRTVSYSKIDLGDIQNAMQQAKTECEALTGGPQVGRRRAIIAGSRRSRW